MRKIGALVLVSLVMVLAVHAQVQIANFAGNGTLTWNSPSGSVSTIEWASSLAPTSDWKRHWVDLSDIRSTNGQSTAPVPMFYRVSCWTNGLFLSMPIGRTYVYRVTATNGDVSTVEMSCMGLIEGPAFTNGSHAVLVSFVGVPDTGGGQFQSIAASSDAAYSVDPNHNLVTRWQYGPIGMTWTNPVSDGDVMAVTIVTNETVVVPAGSFGNCMKFRELDINEPPDGNHENQWWIKPGFFIVKVIWDYDEHQVMELMSWRDE